MSDNLLEVSKSLIEEAMWASLCLGSINRSVNSTLAVDLGLRLLHVDASRAEEIADTVMALFLGLLRRTHLLSRHALSAAGWLGPFNRFVEECNSAVAWF
nr:c-terminal binding protein an [Quercus suber]